MGVWRLYRRPVSDVNVGPVVKAGVTNHSAGRIVAVAHYVSISIEHLFAGRLLGFQKRHFERYKEALKAAMLERVPEITFPTSAWTSGTIRAEDIAK